MDNIREKLVELLDEARAKRREICYAHTDCNSCVFGEEGENCGDKMIADHLLANGVTVQEWIPVAERLPEEGGLYITFGCTAVPVRWLHNFDKDIGKFGSWWNYEPDGKEHPRYRFIEAGNISHWAPLPTPPKGE